MLVKKIDNFNGIIKIIVSIFLSLACIFLVGTHSHLNYFLVILFLSFLRKNQFNKNLEGTFYADLVLSILFLSFTGSDYADFSSFRWRAHILSPVLPPISLFVSLIYFYELKRNDFKVGKFSEVQTSFPVFAILLGIVSGITTEINHGVEMFSTFHLLAIIFFVFGNFITLKIFFKKEFFLIKLFPLSFFLLIILICKSKIYIFVSLVYSFLSFERIIFKRFLNQASISIFNKLFSFLMMMLSSLFLIIMIGGINLNYIGRIAKPLDSFLTYRLSINSSLFYALNYLDVEKVSPKFLPNREFQLSKKFKRIIDDQEIKKKRIENLTNIYDIETINQKILIKNFHNSFLYYYLIHEKIWNHLLYIFLITFSGIFFMRNQLSVNLYYFLYLGVGGFLTYIPYLILIFTFSAILISLELLNILEKEYTEKII